MAEISTNVYSMDDVLRKWHELVGSGEEEKTSVSKRFQYILKNKLKLSKTEISWFKEKKGNQIDRFIFRADKRAHLYLNDILYICGKRSATLTPSEEQKLINCFAAILPYPIAESDEKVCRDIFNQRAYRIEQVIHDNNKRPQEEFYRNSLFVRKCAKSEPVREKRKEFYKYQYGIVMKWYQKWTAVMDKAGGIRKAERAECVYLCKNVRNYTVTQKDEKDFCETGKSENVILQGTYAETKRICTKDLCQYVLWCFITGRLKLKKDEDFTEKAIMEDAGNREGCIEACSSLFCKIITHQLSVDSIEDFEHISKEAIKELENINKILCQDDKVRKRKNKSFYPEVEILRQIKKADKERQKHQSDILELRYCTEEDLWDLSNLRKYLNERENETILISDYAKLPVE